MLDFMLDEFARRVKELRPARQWSLGDRLSGGRAGYYSSSVLEQIGG